MDEITGRGHLPEIRPIRTKENLKCSDQLGDLRIYWRITDIKIISSKKFPREWTIFIWLGTGTCDRLFRIL